MGIELAELIDEDADHLGHVGLLSELLFVDDLCDDGEGEFPHLIGLLPVGEWSEEWCELLLFDDGSEFIVVDEVVEGFESNEDDRWLLLWLVEEMGEMLDEVCGMLLEGS